jgi:cytoskeletal protein CcmA (bactofilin family)
MFGNRAQAPIKSLIAEGIVIDGNIRFTEGLRIDGQVTGSVIAEGNQPSILVVSQETEITAGAFMLLPGG